MIILIPMTKAHGAGLVEMNYAPVVPARNINIATVKLNN